MKMHFFCVKEYMGFPRGRIIFLFLSLLISSSGAQDEVSKLILKHADHLDFLGGNSDILQLDGNVHFTHEGIEMYSDHATWYRKSGLVRFVGSVDAIEKDREIIANEITYYSREKRVIAQGDVCIDDSRDKLVLNCGKADYYRRSREFYAYENPELILNPYSDSMEIDIQAKRLQYFAEDSTGAAYDSVVITRKNLVARGGEAQFKRDPETVVLYKNPVVDQENNQLTGDTISIYSQDRTIERLVTEGNARAVYTMQPDTSYEEYTTAELTGKELEVFFENDKVHKAVMRHNAISVYTPASTDTLTKGVNKASGDSITLFFDEGAIQRVYISGGAEGKYIEPKTAEEGTVTYDTTTYFGSVIDYDFSKSSITLENNSSLHYQDMVLESGLIQYNVNSRILSAEGLKNDSTGEVSQLPVILQGTEKLDGVKMTYNLDSDRGQVSRAKTVYENAYYNSEKIRQVSKDEMLVSKGNYTSCDREEDTHYHFHSNKMKMIGKDKVVAKPVILYIGEIPVFAIPYYVFPIRKGRHSGFLTFEIGNFERGQRFIRNVGYYWAASDYWDLESSIDFYENVRILFNNYVRYGLRYNVLKGSVRVKYSRETAWSNYRQNKRSRWSFDFSHNQTISPTVSLAGYGTFVSDRNFIADNIYDPQERLNRTVSSTGSLTKRWNSLTLTISADQDWNLDLGSKRNVLPSIRLTRQSLPIFHDPATSRKKERSKPWEEREIPSKKFYHNIYFSFNTIGQNLSQRADSTSYWKRFQTLNSNASLSLSQNAFGYFTITPFTRATQTVYHVEWNRVTDSLGLQTDRLFSRETYILGIGASTNLYGTVYPNFLGITGLRHTLTPDISYSFTPEIDKNEQYFKYTGVGASSKRSKKVNFSLTNLFQAKYRSGEDEKKLDLLNVRTDGWYYDFTQPVRKIGDPNLAIRTAAIPHLSVVFSSGYSFYNFDDSRRPLTNPRLTGINVTSSFSGGYRQGGGEGDSEDGSANGGRTRSPFDRNRGMGETSSKAGFDFTIRHQYSASKVRTGTIKSQWLDFGLDLKPTSGWNISYHTHYGVEDKRIESQTLNITRDLHCWAGSFTWIPTGPTAGYYIRINIKSLPDIKIEKSEGGVRGIYY